MKINTPTWVCIDENQTDTRTLFINCMLNVRRKGKLNFKQLSTLKCHRLIFPETNYFRKVLIKFLNSMLKNLFKQNVAKLSEIHQRDKNFCKLLIRIIIRMKVSLMMYWVQFEWGLKHPRREYRDNEEWKKVIQLKSENPVHHYEFSSLY
jgi:hypothetical protein